MYTSENYVADYIVSLNMQRTFEDVLYNYKVDLVLAGHYHSYEVSKTVFVLEYVFNHVPLADLPSLQASVHCRRSHLCCAWHGRCSAR